MITVWGRPESETRGFMHNRRMPILEEQYLQPSVWLTKLYTLEGTITIPMFLCNNGQT